MICSWEYSSMSAQTHENKTQHCLFTIFIYIIMIIVKFNYYSVYHFTTPLEAFY